MSRPRALLLAAAVLVLGVLVAYAPIGGHDWVAYDDDVYLLENPHVAGGLRWDAVRWVSTHSYAANYHPLTWVAHMLDVELFGLEPAGHHWMNVALHALNAALALLLLARLVPSLPAAAAGAALFALHPLRVESVAWAAERKDVLCATFLLAATLLWLRYARAPSVGAYLATCGAFLLALLAKPAAVAFPLVVVLLDSFLPAAGGPRPWRAKAPFFVLAAAAGVVTFWAQARDGSTSSLGDLPPDLRGLNALRSLGVYLAQTFVPRGLAVYYPHAAIVEAQPARALLGPALAGLALLVGGFELARRTRGALPALGAGLGIALATLLPVLGVVQVGTQAHADRYTYLPSIGLALAAAGVLARLFTLPDARRPAAVAGVVLALVLGVLTRAQLATWQDTRTLFEHALALDERNHVAHLKLGEVALDAGDLPRARASFERALALHPSYVEALINLAQCLRAEGELPAAQAHLERALLLDPEGHDVWLNLGAVALERGDLAAARTRLEALRLRTPDDPDVLYNLGHLALAEQRPAEAEHLFRAVLALAPENADAWSNLGRVQLAAGRASEAVATFARVLALAPDDPLAHFNLGIARTRAGDHAGAAACFARALELDPELEPARAALQADAGGG